MKKIPVVILLFLLSAPALCQLKNAGEMDSAKSVKRILNLPKIYTFTGNGNWSLTSNWENGEVPFADIPPGSEIRINSLVPGGKCILDVPFEIPNTTNTIKLTVYSGNELVVPDLIVR
ncbi:hypothetical protein EFY79_06450 [Hanamia caeni]|jgi:hypothetical protein|uniref:Uncharacterized protein n=1 Tax=Hanamia caeni TaxID=2294116 RepID=A0A3M9NJA8_9BACT|nr:hypothetical protein [Hanamia caeni]RNI37879.1 hypothetical protein EFY79_06450 [Hanamia caeni]